MELNTHQQFKLSAQAKSSLEAFVAQNRLAIIEASKDPINMAEFIDANAHKLPPSLLEQAKNFREGKTDIFLIKNVSVVENEDVIPSTPETGLRVHLEIRERLLIEPTMLLISAIMGTSYEPGEPPRFLHVIPSVGYEDTDSLVTSHKLAPHTDSIRMANMPDIGVLGCIRGQTQSKTMFYPSSEVLKHIDAETEYQLRHGDFVFEGGQELMHPILEDDILRYSGRIRGWDKKSRDALAVLRKAIDKVDPIEVSLEEGDVILWRNDRYLHSRTRVNFIEGRESWQNRWVVRLNGYSQPIA